MTQAQCSIATAISGFTQFTRTHVETALTPLGQSLVMRDQNERRLDTVIEFE
jgi:hypothetical protein